jgi:hypothetical protein
MKKTAKAKTPAKAEEKKPAEGTVTVVPEAKPIPAELVPATLSPDEKKKLEKLESTIHEKLEDFFDVGNALLAIKNENLFRDTHSDFEAYCKERWEISRSYANKLIGSAERIRLLPEDCPKPENEFQMRPFLKLEPQAFPDKWRSIVKEVGDGKVTSKIVSKTLNLPRTAKTSRVSKRKKKIHKLLDSIQTALKEKNVEDALKVLAALDELLRR